MNIEEFWCNFINLYHSLPATWQVKSEIYKNLVFMQKMYLNTTDKLKEIDSTVYVNSTKKNIHRGKTNE